MKSKNPKMNKPTVAQRAAQSARDKAIAAQSKSPASPMNPLIPKVKVQQRTRGVKRAGLAGPLLPRGVANRDRQSFLREIITFDEYIGEVNGSVTFVATKYPLNPGLAGTFPKGSLKAALYSEWKQQSCEFYYKPEVSGFATQGQGGKVILAMDYNAGNPAPTTKQQVEIMHRVDDMPYESMLLATDSASVNRSDAKYIRTGPIPVDEDIKTFDGGNLWVCTFGQANTNVVGELHVRYSFVCSKPTLLNPAQGALLPNVTVGMFESAAAETPAATTVARKLLAATVLSNGVSVVNTSGSFVPPAGNYVIDATLTARSSGAQNIDIEFDVQKNGTSLYQAGLSPLSNAVENSLGTLFQASVSQSLYVSCNGTDAITFPYILTYSSGSPTVSGTVRFLAV